MPTLYALLVGIDQYPTPRHQLQGCVRDQGAVKQYLEQFAAGAGLQLEMQELMDTAATRTAVIQGFTHFQAAQKGDICLFSFSGHGSRNDAPEAFWHLEPDRLNESIVLWDSRVEGGRDLMDKELSYLIWNATKDKDIQFIALLDCCHSGSGTRKDDGIRSRMAEKGNDMRSLEEMEGYAFYEKGNEGLLSPPRGRHIMLGAARDNQTAKELTFEGSTHGVFTYSLLETLRQYGNQLTYAELLNHLRIRLAQRVKEQSPQLEAIAGADPNLLFLSNTRTSGRPAYLVGYEGSKGWHVNAGAFDGFKGGSTTSPTELQLEADGHQLRVLDVYPGYSTVEGMPADTPPEGVHRALVTKWGSGGLKLAFTPDSDAAAKSMLSNMLEKHTDGLLQLVDDPTRARYHMHTGDQSLSLLLPGEKYPLFQRIRGHEPANGAEFLKRVGVVARWVQMLELANPQTTLQDGEIKIELFRLAEPGKHADSDPVVTEDWRQAVSFRYFYQEGKWTLPAMQLKITNTGTRTLWVSVLYMTSNFGMFNPLLPKQELGPGQEAWLLDVAYGVPHRSILLQMEEAYHSWGINQISDYLKVLVCTEEFSTDAFNQEGLPLDEREGGTRGFALWEDLSQSDWLTREIELRVVRPFDPIDVKGIFTQLPDGFSGKAMRNTLPEATAAFPVAYAPQLEDGGEFSTAGDLCVLELWDCPAQTIDAANPLQLSSPEGVIPYLCDPQTGRFKVLAHSWENDTLVLQELPPESPSPYQGLPATHKIFFHQSL